MIRPPRVTELFAAGLVLAAGLVAMPARAQQGSSIAEQLFVEGKALMQSKQYALACEKLKASHDIDRTATGTLLNLALCHEQVNKPASAWAEFRQVAAESAGRREDRVQLAREHEAKLFPKLSRIRIFVPPDARTKGLSLQLDGTQPIAEASWGIELPIDPGKHVIEATAPAKVARSQEFVVGDVSDRQTVAIEPLADAPVDPAEEARRIADEKQQSSREKRRIIGYAAGGVGLAAITIGLFFGQSASKKNKDAKALCADDGRCTDEATRQQASDGLSAAKTQANVANLTVGAGALFLVGGILLVVTALPGDSRATPKPTALRAAPVPLAGGGGFVLEGAF